MTIDITTADLSEVLHKGEKFSPRGDNMTPRGKKLTKVEIARRLEKKQKEELKNIESRKTQESTSPKSRKTEESSYSKAGRFGRFQKQRDEYFHIRSLRHTRGDIKPKCPPPYPSSKLKESNDDGI